MQSDLLFLFLFTSCYSNLMNDHVQLDSSIILRLVLYI